MRFDMLTSWDIIIYRITRKLQRCLERSFSISFFSPKQWGGFCSRELSIIENNISTSYFSNGKSLTILRIEIWQGQGPQGVRGPLLRFHTFFQRTRLITHSNHRERHLMKKLLGQCFAPFLVYRLVVSPFHHPSTVEFFSPEYRLLSKIKRSRCFSLQIVLSIDVDVQICLGVPKCPHFAPRFVLLLSQSEYNKKGDRYEELLYMLW